MTEAEGAILAGGYWLRRPTPGAELALVGAGAIVPEVLATAVMRSPTTCRISGFC